MPMLLVLPLEIVDTSGETPSRAKEHGDRLAALTHYLSKDLAAHGLYAVTDPTPIDAEINKARASQPLYQCHGCERDLARLVHADRVLIGEVDKSQHIDRQPSPEHCRCRDWAERIWPRAWFSR